MLSPASGKGFPPGPRRPRKRPSRAESGAPGSSQALVFDGVAPPGIPFAPKRDTSALPNCDFEVFSRALSATRPGQTGRKVGAQSHGPPTGAAELPYVVDPSQDVTEGATQRNPSLSVSGRAGLEKPLLPPGAPPWRSRRGGVVPLPGRPGHSKRTSPAQHGTKHTSPGHRENAFGRHDLRLRQGLAHPEAWRSPLSTTGIGSPRGALVICY